MENMNQEVQGQEEVTTMELLPAGSEYRDIAAKAKELGMNYVGVKKDDLLAQVNEYITKINNGEAEMPAEVEAPQTSDENEDEGNDAPQAAKPESPAKAAARKAATKTKERTVRQATKKWFEEPGANPYNEGDIVEIIGGKDLIGRKLQVIEPSAKKDMVKGRLIHPVTGGLQNTVIAIAFERIQLLQSAAENAADEPQEVNDNQDGVNEEPTNETNDQEVETTENEGITAGSDESVDIPSMEVEEEEEKKAE